jgi:hypothetical protein
LADDPEYPIERKQPQTQSDKKVANDERVQASRILRDEVIKKRGVERNAIALERSKFEIQRTSNSAVAIPNSVELPSTDSRGCLQI